MRGAHANIAEHHVRAIAAHQALHPALRSLAVIVSSCRRVVYERVEDGSVGSAGRAVKCTFPHRAPLCVCVLP